MAVEEEYIFPRDYFDNNRINLQHYLWIQIFGYYLHPCIPTETPRLRIADIGMGTGIWLTDLVEKLPPSAEFYGLDISFAATPPRAWLPANLTLQHWDVRTEPPEELVGTFDIVNIRLFVLVLSEDEIGPVIQRMLKLLKPGGYLQWAEPDMDAWRIEKTDPKNKCDALRQILTLGEGDQERLRPKWVSKLPSFFSKHGLQDIEVDARDTPQHLRIALHDCGLFVPELLLRGNIYKGPAKYKVSKLLEEAARETTQGSSWVFTRWHVVGRKPLAV